MKHLTTAQVLEYVDQTADEASLEQCASHIPLCDRCRKEVEFHKRLASAARLLPSTKVSRRFTDRVMAAVVPREGKAWSTKILDNLGNIMAMALVLGVLGYATVAAPGSRQTDENSPTFQVMKQFGDAYAKAREVFMQQTTQTTRELAPRSSDHTQRFVLFAILVVVVLLALDKFVVRQFLRMRL